MATAGWSKLARFRVSPMIGLVLLMLGVGAYAAAKSSVFLSSSNLNAWLTLALPLVILALGQQVALISGEFDISIGSTVSLTVCLASYWATADSTIGTVPGILGCLAVGVAIGLLNSFVVNILRVPAIIATIGTLGIVAGVAILVRPTPGGAIGLGLTTDVARSIGFVPALFIIIVVVAVLLDVLRTRTPAGLLVRAVGFSPESSVRTGVRVLAVKTASYVICALGAVVAGIVLATQVSVGSNDVGVGYPLTAFTACFLGGAALTGGRGAFVGALLGAMFLTMLVNITPIVGWPDATSVTATGVLTIVAVFAYALEERNRRRAAASAAMGRSGGKGFSSISEHKVIAE